MIHASFPLCYARTIPHGDPLWQTPWGSYGALDKAARRSARDHERWADSQTLPMDDAPNSVRIDTIPATPWGCADKSVIRFRAIQDEITFATRFAYAGRAPKAFLTTKAAHRYAKEAAEDSQKVRREITLHDDWLYLYHPDGRVVALNRHLLAGFRVRHGYVRPMPNADVHHTTLPASICGLVTIPRDDAHALDAGIVEAAEETATLLEQTVAA